MFHPWGSYGHPMMPTPPPVVPVPTVAQAATHASAAIPPSVTNFHHYHRGGRRTNGGRRLVWFAIGSGATYWYMKSHQNRSSSWTCQTITNNPSQHQLEDTIATDLSTPNNGEVQDRWSQNNWKSWREKKREYREAFAHNQAQKAQKESEAANLEKARKDMWEKDMKKIQEIKDEKVVAAKAFATTQLDSLLETLTALRNNVNAETKTKEAAVSEEKKGLFRG